MKRLFKLLILIGILAVLGVAYAVIVTIMADKRPDTPADDSTTDQMDTQYTAARIDISSMYALKYNCGKDVYSFSLSPDETRWLWSENTDLPLDNNYFAMMASSLNEVTTDIKFKTNNSELSTYGLDSPWLTVTVSDNIYGTQTFSFGALNSFTGQYYFSSSSDSETVYLVDEIITVSFKLVPTEMVSNDIIPTIPEDSISMIQISSPSEDVVYRCHTDEALDAWYSSTAGGDEVPVEAELASKLGIVLDGVKFEDPIGFSSEDRREYGLSEPTEMTIYYTEVKTVTDSQSGVSTDISIDSEFRLLLGYSDGKGNIYAGVPDSVLCYCVDGEILSNLCAMITKSN